MSYSRQTFREKIRAGLTSVEGWIVIFLFIAEWLMIVPFAVLARLLGLTW